MDLDNLTWPEVDWKNLEIEDVYFYRMKGIEMLSIKEMLIGMPVRLRYVDRFSTCRVMKKESVAEHSFYVAFYSLMIAWWCETKAAMRLGSAVDLGLLFAKTLLHDIDEAATGDVPRFFKYSDATLKNHLDEVAQKGVYQIAKKLWDEASTIDRIESHWKNAKDDTTEGKILEFADFLSVLSYAAEEIRSSNFTMREHLTSMVEYYEKFTTEDFNFIRPLVEEARTILFEEILLDGA